MGRYKYMFPRRKGKSKLEEQPSLLFSIVARREGRGGGGGGKRARAATIFERNVGEGEQRCSRQEFFIEVD